MTAAQSQAGREIFKQKRATWRLSAASAPIRLRVHIRDKRLTPRIGRPGGAIKRPPASESGAEVNAATRPIGARRSTPQRGNQAAVAQLLLAHGADVRARTDQRTPLTRRHSRRALRAVLRAAGATISQTARRPKPKSVGWRSRVPTPFGLEDKIVRRVGCPNHSSDTSQARGQPTRAPIPERDTA
jgi:hypothetical protein